eukprot:m.1006718 g.1006718  ORF g.1006718 m.1006718 type:complete len:94 (+) comp24056_c1_seq10:1502-1783(+)
MSIACIIAHLSQIVLDSYLITQWIDGEGTPSDAQAVEKEDQVTSTDASTTGGLCFHPAVGVTYAVEEPELIEETHEDSADHVSSFGSGLVVFL